ncbi:MAG: hypothetical protein K8M05_07125 [Deltaproteobacteria bacterium]|nr:hypothetical protein [Kofleriaceae bacterium]
MLAPYLVDEHTPAALRELLRDAPVPSVQIPAALDDAAVAALRARALAAELVAYDLADRGRYHHDETLRDEPLFAQLAWFAAGVTATPLVLARACWLVQRRGDYSLVKDDWARRPRGRLIEVVVDLSAGTSGEAEAVYVDGAQALAVPQLGGLLAVVDRSPSCTRFLRPPTIRSLGGFEVVRLFLQFEPAAR